MNGIDYDLFISRLFAKAEKSGVPLGGSFELTSRCTLNCKMCYIHRRENDAAAISGEKSAEWWLNLAAKAKDAGMLLLLLTGGEPLIRRDFDEIYLGCKKMGLLVSVNTNGTLINDKKIRLFAENPPQRLNVTLYGACEKTYEDLCGSAAAYRKAVDAIKALKKANVNIKLNYSITPENAADASEAYELAKSLDIPIQPVSYMFSPVRSYGETVRLSAAEAAKAQFDWRRRHLGDEDFKKYILHKQSAPIPDAFCSDTINCRAGSTTFWVTWSGEMTPCGMMPEPNVPIEDFGEAWQRLRDERKNILLPSECKSCALRRECDMCAAVSKAESGRYGGLPQYACEKAHEYAKLCSEFIKNRQ